MNRLSFHCLKYLAFFTSLFLSTISFADFIAVGHRNYTASANGYLFIFGEPGVTGTISSNDGGMDQSFTIPTAGVLEVSVAEPRFFQASEVDATLNRALFIKSNDPISGYFLNRRTSTTDMSYLLDTDSLGKDFRLVTYNLLSSSYPAQFSITATEDNTSITITPNNNLTSGQVALVPFTKTLNAGESLFYESTASDLTGSLINANKPVAVFSGNLCANVPPGIYACDHLFTQLPATNQFANKFIVPETAFTGSAGNVIRIIADADGTQININGSTVATIDAGEFYELDPALDSLIETSNPVLIAQYLKGNFATGLNGDPALTFIPGIDQVLDDYVFSTPTGSAVFDDNYLNIAIPTSALASLTLNNVVVDTSGFTTLGSTGYSTGNIPIAVGNGRITADAPFLATISGYSSADSYLTIIGTTYSSGASPNPNPSASIRVQAIPSLSSLGLIFAMVGLGWLARRRSV